MKPVLQRGVVLAWRIFSALLVAVGVMVGPLGLPLPPPPPPKAPVQDVDPDDDDVDPVPPA